MKKSKIVSLIGLASLFTGLSSCTKNNNNNNPSNNSSNFVSTPTSTSTKVERTTDASSFTYKVSGDKVTITGLKDPDFTHIVLPDEIDGKKVTAILDDSFKNNSNIKTFKINKYLTKISGLNFLGSNNLEKIEVDNDNETLKVENNLLLSRKPITEGGDLYVLYFGLGLLNNEQLTIPNNIGKLDKYALAYATSKKIIIPASVTDIDTSAFTYCSNLEDFEVENGNTTYEVENNCLVFNNSGNKTLLAGTKKSTIPDDCNTIGANAFRGIDIKNLTIKNNIKKFNQGRCFKDSGIEELHFDNDVNLSSGFNEALTDASKLKILDIPSGASLFQNYESQLSGCSSLENVNFLGKAIDKNYFDRFYFPDITNDLTFDFGSIKGYTQDSDKFVYYTSGSTKTLIGYFGATSKKIENITLPDVNIINEYAFFKANIKNITINSITTELGGYAFEYSSLETIDFGNISSIGKGIFSKCKNLKTITWPSNISEIPLSTFTNAHVEKLIIGSNIVTHNQRIIDGGCIDYLEVDSNNTIYSTSVDHRSLLSKDGKIAYFLFPDKNKKITLPDGVERLYQFAAYEREANEVTGGKDLTKIDSDVFRESKLTVIEIPSKVNTIGDRAFYSSKVETIIFKNPNIIFGNNIFVSRSNLSTITFYGTLDQFKTVFGSTKEEYKKLIYKSITVKYKSSAEVEIPDTTKTTDEIYA